MFTRFCPWRLSLKRRLTAALVVALVGMFSLTELQGQDRPTPDTVLDRAIRDLDAAAQGESEHTHSHPPEVRSAPRDRTELGVLQSFYASWALFHNSYWVGWLVSLLLALVGVVVVARDQIFIGAAVSQASTLGIALALCASSVFPLHVGGTTIHSASWLCCDSFQVLMAVVFSVAAALLTSWADRARGESHEAVTGWIFLVSAGLSVLVVAHSPHGAEEIRRIHSSSIIGATPADVRIFGGLLLLTILLFAGAGRRLLLFVTDPAMAAAVGMKIGLWALAAALWLGLVVGLSIRVSGMLFTFGSLVLPALVAKNVCREIRPMFFVAPLVALLASAVGFVLANRYDYPPAQMNVAVAGAILPLAWAWRSFRRGAWQIKPLT